MLGASSVRSYAKAFAGYFGKTALIGGWLACAGPAIAASLTSRDVQIIAKVLGFLDPAPSGGRVAVVYAAGNAASRADAEAIVASFGDGISSGGGTITARLIDRKSLPQSPGYIAVILAAGAEDAGPSTPMPHGILSITAADELVLSGACVMAVHSQPRVDITVNHAAAQAAGVAFTSAFSMLVHER